MFVQPLSSTTTSEPSAFPHFMDLFLRPQHLITSSRSSQPGAFPTSPFEDYTYLSKRPACKYSLEILESTKHVQTPSSKRQRIIQRNTQPLVFPETLPCICSRVRGKLSTGDLGFYLCGNYAEADVPENPQGV